MPTASARTVIVVPCYQEANRLEVGRYRDFADSKPDVDFVLVDDGSTDGTRALLDSLARDLPGRFRVLAQASNSGKAEAVRVGVLDAFEGNAAFAGFWDADLAAPLEELPRFIELLETHPALLPVFGSRVKLLGRKIERDEFRHYAGRIFNTCAAMTLGIAVYDTQCGAKLFRNDPEVRRCFREPFLGRWTFDVEILARMIAGCPSAAGASIDDRLYEYPLRSWRELGESKVRPWDMLTGPRGAACPPHPVSH